MRVQLLARGDLGAYLYGRLALLAIMLLGFASVTAGQAMSGFRGKMLEELAPDLVHVYQRVFTGAKVDTLQFEPALAKGAVVSKGAFTDQTQAEGSRQAYLIEEPAETSIAFDLNGDGTIDREERFQLSKSSNGTFEAVITVPFKHRFFQVFPIFVRYHAGFRHPQLKPTDRLLEQSVWALAFGRVGINGRPVLFQYPFDPLSDSISTTRGLFGIDVDGDGQIRNEQFSPETSYASDVELVFRYGDLYLSTFHIDLEENEVVVRIHRKEDYHRVEIEVGEVMPNFDFIDFDGKERSLTDYRGKYVLIDFWGLWCNDCLIETPFHVKAYKLFMERGFDILSINTDDDIAPVVEYMRKHGMTWTQAKKESVKDLIEKDYRIQEYPSTILLDPEGRVLVLDQRQMRGERLLKTLGEHLPKAPAR